MRIEILATGDELLSGAVANTNAATLSWRLFDLGLPVWRHVAVGDEPGEITGALAAAAAESDVALVTGGLGPTTDDLTVEVFARFAGRPLVIHPGALGALEAFVTRRGFTLSESNRKQAFVPEGAEVFLNPAGSAPALSLTVGRCTFFLLPGVPREIDEFWRSFLRDRLAALAAADPTDAGRLLRLQEFQLFGIPEADVNEAMATFDPEFPGVRVGYRAHFPVIQVKLLLRDHTPDALAARLAACTAWMRGRFGRKLFDVGSATLPEMVVRALAVRAATLALAESCTGGRVADLVTNVPGASEVLLGGAVTYANTEKVRQLGVLPATLEQYGAVSEPCALEMARGIRAATGATYGLALTGIAGPSGGTPDKPVGTVWIALATPQGERAKSYFFPLDRERFKTLAAFTALNRLRLALTTEAGATDA